MPNLYPETTDEAYSLLKHHQLVWRDACRCLVGAFLCSGLLLGLCLVSCLFLHWLAVSRLGWDKSSFAMYTSMV